MKGKILVAFLLILFSSKTIEAQEVISPGFGKGILDITARDSSFYMNFSARFQGLFTSQWESFNDGETYPFSNSGFMIRRARLKFKGFAFTPKLKYKLEIGLSNSDIDGASIYTGEAPRQLIEAVLKWNFYENFEFWVGQTKLPGNREQIISSGELQFVATSILDNRFNIGRDLGIQLWHSFEPAPDFIIREAIAISQGEGRNITTGNYGGYQYTGRLEILPLGAFEGDGAYVGADLAREETPKLAVGASYDLNHDAVRTRSNNGIFMVTENGFHTTNISTFFLDAMFKYRGFSLMGEYANREAKEPIARNPDGTLTGEIVNIGEGYNLQGGYVFKNNFEISGRYSHLNFDDITYLIDESHYTLGLSKYIVGHKLKVQTDLTYIDVLETTENSILYRLQFELHF